MGSENKDDLFARLLLFLMSATLGYFAFRIMLIGKFDFTITAGIFMLLLYAASLYFFYIALFYNKIRRKREKKSMKRKRERIAHLAAIQEDQFLYHFDTTTLILLDKVKNFEELGKGILSNIDDKDSWENQPLLKKLCEGRYAITFPYGVTRQNLYLLLDTIMCFCECTVQAWCRPELFKKHAGEWLYLCIGADDEIVAVDENGIQWDINYDDAILHRSKKHDRSYEPRPELTDIQQSPFLFL